MGAIASRIPAMTTHRDVHSGATHSPTPQLKMTSLASSELSPRHEYPVGAECGYRLALTTGAGGSELPSSWAAMK